MAFLDDIKTTLRIDGTANDGEVSDLIDACSLDLQIAGADPAKLVESDALYKRAVILYCRMHFDYDKAAIEGYAEAYEKMKLAMSISSRYRLEADDDAGS